MKSDIIMTDYHKSAVSKRKEGNHLEQKKLNTYQINWCYRSDFCHCIGSLFYHDQHQHEQLYGTHT